MKTFLSALFIILSQATFSQNIVQFKISKPYCLFNFLQTASGNQRTSVTFRKMIDNSLTQKDLGFKSIVEQFKGLELEYSYNRGEYPENRHQSRSVLDLIIIQAVQSDNLAEFKQKTIGILPNTTHQQLFALLAASEKYYDLLVWFPEQKKIAEQLDALKKYQVKANELFDKYKTFYNSSWTSDIPFTVSIFPIPGKRGNSTATPHANSLCVGVLSEEKDHDVRMGVVMHEMCHVLFDEQSNPFQHYLDSLFVHNASEYRHFAYSYLDEGLATALGNGWTPIYLTGKPDETSWYDDPYINGYAHALFPIVDQYLKAGKSMDLGFVNQAINQFEKTFPNSIRDYGILFNKLSIYSDAEEERDRTEQRQIMGKNFRTSSSNASAPIADPVSISQLKENQGTQLILVEKNQALNWGKIKEVFPETAGMLVGKDDPNFILNFFDKGKRLIVVIQAENKRKMEKAFDLLKKQQLINPATPYLKVE
jgi:hypothetical protein